MYESEYGCVSTVAAAASVVAACTCPAGNRVAFQEKMPNELFQVLSLLLSALVRANVVPIPAVRKTV